MRDLRIARIPIPFGSAYDLDPQERDHVPGCIHAGCLPQEHDVPRPFRRLPPAASGLNSSGSRRGCVRRDRLRRNRGGRRRRSAVGRRSGLVRHCQLQHPLNEFFGHVASVRRRGDDCDAGRGWLPIKAMQTAGLGTSPAARPRSSGEKAVTEGDLAVSFFVALLVRAANSYPLLPSIAESCALCLRSWPRSSL